MIDKQSGAQNWELEIIREELARQERQQQREEWSRAAGPCLLILFALWAVACSSLVAAAVVLRWLGVL